MAEVNTPNNPEKEPSITEENISVAEKAPKEIIDNLKSTTVPEATDIPTANAPDSATIVANQEEAEAKGTATVAKAKKGAAAKAPKPATDGEPAAKAPKKEKAPAVEDKPFVEFMQQDYLPALKAAIASSGVSDIQLNFAKQKVPIIGFEHEDCWQVVGSLQNNARKFNLYFPEEDIQGKKAFSCNEGKFASTLESFLIDERKITLDLMVFGAVQRLNGQKWLALN
ncbi:MAG: DUF2996 domain-containing protein [Nostocaceae cyanobacterium]|nr:DUF2996 domain-containing protein [Nostocaceae cyanobacterium]